MYMGRSKTVYAAQARMYKYRNHYNLQVTQAVLRVLDYVDQEDWRVNSLFMAYKALSYMPKVDELLVRNEQFGGEVDTRINEITLSRQRNIFMSC